jgi:hypothetical protein
VVAAGDGDRARAGTLEVTRGREDGVVLDRAHHHVPTPFIAPALEHAAQRQVVRLRARPREDDLALRASEDCRDPVARPVDRRTRGATGCVHR